jgi:hypothetical protein
MGQGLHRGRCKLIFSRKDLLQNFLYHFFHFADSETVQALTRALYGPNDVHYRSSLQPSAIKGYDAGVRYNILQFDSYCVTANITFTQIPSRNIA